MAPEMKNAAKSTFIDKYVKFLVGPDDFEFILERSKLSKFVHTLDQFNSTNNHADIDPSSFQVFADMVNGKGIAITSATIALQLLGFAEKIYSLKLQLACTEYMKSNYKSDQAPIIYEYAKMDGLQELANNCLEYMKYNFDEVIKSENFLKINTDTIVDLYSRENLKATNGDMNKAIVKYACHKIENVRSQLKVAVDMICSGDMQVNELLNMIQVDGLNALLTSDDLLEKIKTILRIEKPNRIEEPLKYGSLRILNNPISDKFEIQNTRRRLNYVQFSSNVILEAMEIDEYVFDMTKTVVEISSIPIPFQVDGDWILINETVNKNTKVSIKLSLLDFEDDGDKSPLLECVDIGYIVVRTDSDSTIPKVKCSKISCY